MAVPTTDLGMKTASDVEWLIIVRVLWLAFSHLRIAFGSLL